MRDEYLHDGNSIICLDACGSPTLLTGSLVETVMASVIVPAAIVGPNSAFRLWFFFTCTNNANPKNFRTRWNGTVTGAQPSIAGNSNWWITQYGFNRGAKDSQVWWASTAIGASGAPMLASAIDFSVDVTLTATMQLTNVGDVVTLEGYSIELLNASPS